MAAQINGWKQHLFELTPLGKADKDVREYLKESLDPAQFKRYQRALKHYRHLKLVQATLKVLLYAGILTSVAATLGFSGEIRIIQQIASYVGTSIIFVLFALTSYITMIRREAYHVQREILISKASNSGETLEGYRE
ncbi:MAG: hypothetical protein ABEJ07_04435 [Candidatus Nanohaloarchaea archaeon]